MYSVAIIGDNPTAHAAAAACRRAGFDELTHFRGNPTAHAPATTLSANLTRVVQALVGSDTLRDIGLAADREQVRLTPSGYMVTELPLGNFIDTRYGAPHLNVELNDLVKALQTDTLQDEIALPAAERNFDAVLVNEAIHKERHQDSAWTHTLWWSSIPHAAAPGRANITWLGDTRLAWQFATPSHLHVALALPQGEAPERQHWHASLHEAVTLAVPRADLNLAPASPRSHLVEGHVAYLGPARFANSLLYREAEHFGIEDAWVLSRMMENYEEDYAEALAQYEKYRRGRTNKIADATRIRAAAFVNPSQGARIRRNLALAFGARFLPEIAMQKIDWLYGYDCIRGFR